MPELNVIVATDCGSTTTKAILIEKVDGVYRQTFRGEAPTTVEAPFEDITRGVLNALTELEELSGRKILDGEKIVTPAQGKKGVDVYVSTSSAGGGLQMMVSGAVKEMTGESAQRAALGAGAIVMDVLANNDGRLPHEKIERIRSLRPDMMLLCGGTDGGTITHVVELAEFIAAANPRPRLGHNVRLPVIFAGNKDARQHVTDRLEALTDLAIVDNLRPTMETENLLPARLKIQDLFMEHVMAQAPGYDRLMKWVGAPILPTPGAVGKIMQTIARNLQLNLLGVDIGGATTDVFSIVAPNLERRQDQIYNRTVSANLGMSYSVSNVLAEAGVDRIRQWLPFAIDETDLRNRVKNKMIRPTTVPQTLEDLIIEHALAREALRMSVDQHKLLATGLKGVQKRGGINEMLGDHALSNLVDMATLDLIVGSGGVLSHAPRRAQSLLIMLDAFLPTGVTRLAVDSIFMMPHLGVLSEIHEQAATEVFEKDCLVRLGTVVAPHPTSRERERPESGPIGNVKITWPDGESETFDWQAGDLHRIKPRSSETAKVTIIPAKKIDVGAGKGETLDAELEVGCVGLIFDGRGRPLHLPTTDADRVAKLRQWSEALEAYPTSS